MSDQPATLLQWSRHPGIRNKPQSWQPGFATSWLQSEGPLHELRDQILRGEAFIAAAMTSGHRTAAAFAHADLAAVDIDNGLTVEQFLEHPLRQYAAFVYTTASHDPANGKHRFRVLFRLPRRIDDADLYKGVTTILTRALGGDKSCTDPTRLFYGCNTADIPLWEPSNILPNEFLYDAYEVVERQKRVYDDGDTDLDPASIAKAVFCLEQIIPPTEDGQRDQFIRITAAARSGGDSLFHAWSDWASRGHHGSGSRSHQSTERFYRGMRGSSLGTLFYFASEADPDWRRKLPEEIKALSPYTYGRSDTYAGYSYEDFLGDPDDSATHKEAAYGLFDPKAPWAQVAKPEAEPPIDKARLYAGGYEDSDFMGDPDPVSATPPPAAKKGPGRPRKIQDDPIEMAMDRLRRLYPGLRTNIVSQRLEFGPKDNPQPVPDASTTYIRVSRGTRQIISKTMVNDLMQVIGYEQRYNPVHNYLDHCAANVEPCPYFDRLASTLLGVSGNPLENPRMPSGQLYADAVMERMMIGAVARALKPGCDMDWMPILVGSQNLGKTAFFQYLTPPPRHGEDISWTTTLQQSMAAIKEKPHILHAGWLVFLDEIERYFERRYVEDLKNMVSTKSDYSAKKYQNELHYKRSFILVGATNNRDFLRDPTGNRRFMPIPVKGVVSSPEDRRIKIIDLDRLKADRDSLWAAAYQRYEAGKTWLFSSYEHAHLNEYLQGFTTDDPLLPKVAMEVSRMRSGIYQGRNYVRLADLMDALKIDVAQQPSMRRCITDILKSLGYSLKTIRISGSHSRVWIAPSQEEEEARSAEQPSESRRFATLEPVTVRDF